MSIEMALLKLVCYAKQDMKDVTVVLTLDRIGRLLEPLVFKAELCSMFEGLQHFTHDEKNLIGGRLGYSKWYGILYLNGVKVSS